MSKMNGKAQGLPDRPADEAETAALSPQQEDYKVMVSLRFLILTLMSSVLVAFAVGRAARIILLEGPRRALFAPHDSSTLRNRPDYHEGYASRMPPPVAKDGKQIPHTIYTAKNFDTARTASSSLLIRRDQRDPNEPTCPDRTCRAGYPFDGEDEDEHLPAGQHLLVDIKGVEASFLNSEERLAHAMVEVVNQASLTLLSYHCHRLAPSGVSCVGVLLESHVSFHTWPSQGVITLDLFTCGSNPLVPVLPIIERLFGVPASIKETVKVIWAHKLRGFRGDDHLPLSQWDLGTSLLGNMDLEYKREIFSGQTSFQRIDIYDMISARFNSFENFQKSLTQDGSYYSHHPELFAPDRILYLDGVIQSRRYGERAYHESLVHPGMFAHPNPKRVAIVGGGEGATLREVLKHNTVERAVMIEIDEEMVSISRQYLPEWSDCTDLVGSTSWCGDDPRTQMVYGDALGWLIERFHDKENITEGLFDVIIMDALDPHYDVKFSAALYNNEKYLSSLYNALNEEGVLIVQVGESPGLGDAAERFTFHQNRAHMINHLDRLGFKTMHIYGQDHGGYTESWNTLVAGKSLTVRRNWYQNEAEINLQIHRRSLRSNAGAELFHYFDGATMQLFQVPSKRFETVFCRDEPMPQECVEYGGFDPRVPNVDISNFEVKKSTAGEKAGRGIFAKKDIPKGSYIYFESASQNVYFPPNTFTLITEMEKAVSEELTPVEYYMNGYGFQVSLFHGGKEVAVDSTIATFVNHGCRGTYNVGTDTGPIHESSADFVAFASVNRDERPAYNPVLDRHLPLMLSGNDRALRDISAGEEILDNYLAFVGSEDDWEYDLKSLQAQCRGEGDGDVTFYETHERSDVMIKK